MMVSLLQVWLSVALLSGASRSRVVPDAEGIVDGVHDGALDGVLDSDEVVSSDRVSMWATRAHDWLLGTACAGSSSTSSSSPPPSLLGRGPGPATPLGGDLCRDLVRLPRGRIRVYAAGSGDGEQVVATLVGPEGSKALGPHDAVLALDPYPAATFGHLVLVFFVARRTTERECSQLNGLHLENGDCVQPAREPRCAPGGPGGPGGVGGQAGVGGAPCQLLFLPLVTPASRPPNQHHNKLQCRNDTAGFLASPCPRLRPQSQVAHLRCDPVATNTKRCDTTQFIGTRCPFMQTCDHAVLLSGGWNRQLSDHSSLQNVLDFHSMLKHVGFHEDNIKVFFANGVMPERDEEGLEPAMYPSALKLALRHHLHRVCKTTRCADTLLVYLNGPALPGGATLLWDADSNGQMDETEVYSARDLLRDVSQCGARRVLVVADQSFAGDLVRHAAQLHAVTRGLRNVAVLAAPANDNNPWTEYGRYAARWTAPRHRHACLADVVKGVAAHDVFLGSGALLNTTLTGMPCAAALDKDQRHRYSGCQNLSTREWMAAQDDDDGEQDEDDEEGEDADDNNNRARSSENKAKRD